LRRFTAATKEKSAANATTTAKATLLARRASEGIARRFDLLPR